MRKISFLRQLVTQISLVFVGLFVMLPILGMVRLAFDGSLKGRPTEFRVLPKVWSFSPFMQVLDKPYQSVDFLVLLKNSLLVSFGSAVIAIILGVTLAMPLRVSVSPAANLVYLACCSLQFCRRLPS